MTFAIHGLAVARGIAIGRAVSGGVEPCRRRRALFIEPLQVDAEMRYRRLVKARTAAFETNCKRCTIPCPKMRPPNWRPFWRCA
jgi:hypothetical protein